MWVPGAQQRCLLIISTFHCRGLDSARGSVVTDCGSGLWGSSYYLATVSVLSSPLNIN